MSTYNRPFAQQVEFFRKKLNLPTRRSDDIMHEAHDRAFIVAGAQGADLLADLNTAVLKAIEQGTGLNAFRADFRAIVARNGWTGWTGEGSKEGVAWRTKVIYQTNLSTSYAAGRYQQLTDPELLAVLPYWQYRHSDGVMYPRPLHVSWHGLTLPPEHAFWKTHYPPNGWGCHCRVTGVSKRDFLEAVANGRGPAGAPAAGNIDGIDKGFAYAPGASVSKELKALVDGKVAALPAPIGEALAKDAVAVLSPVKRAETLAEAERIGSDLVSAQNEHDWPTHFGGPMTRFSHTGEPWKGGANYAARVAQRFFGKADYRGLDLDTANLINRQLAVMQQECDALGIPRLRGVAISPDNSSRAQMGDGILRVNRATFRSGEASFAETAWKPSAWTREVPTNVRPFSAKEYFDTALDRAQCTLWHEFGHHIHQTAGVNGRPLAYKDPPLEQSMRGPIEAAKRSAATWAPSGYSDTSPVECFAECYALKKMGRAELLPTYMLDMIVNVEKGELP